jgi:hypothetical protein
MDRSDPPAHVTPKRGLRFSLATLLIVVAVIAILCAKVGNRIRAMREATNAIVSAEGMITIERPEDWWQRVGAGEWTQRVLAVHSCHPQSESLGKAIYLEQQSAGILLLDATFDDLVFFQLLDDQRSETSSGRLNDDSLAALAAVAADLRLLEIGTTGVTDAGLRHLGRFPRLRILFLTDASITDAGAAVLATLKELAVLDLKGTKITDATLERLADLTRLQLLRVEETQVTPAGIQKLKHALPNLKVTPDPDAPDSSLADDRE